VWERQCKVFRCRCRSTQRSGRANPGGGVLRRERKYAIGIGGPQGSVDIFDAILLIVIAVGLTTFLFRLGS